MINTLPFDLVILMSIYTLNHMASMFVNYGNYTYEEEF